jgi:predicted lipid carrier protein YhbT
LQRVLDRFAREMESQGDTETGLIKGILDGADISLMRYSLGLAIKSAPGNVKEFFEHLRRRRGEPMRPDERVTDEDIRRLFG